MQAGPKGWGASCLLVVGDGQQTFALSGDRVMQLQLNGDALALRTLPSLPVALTSAVGVAVDGSLYVAGVDASGASQFLQLSPASEAGQWSRLAAWPDGGVPTSLVARIGAVYVTVHHEGAAADRLLRWSSKTGWEDRGATPAAVVAGSGHAIGQAHILYLLRDADGRSRLETFHTISRAWATIPYSNDRRVDSVAPVGNGVLTASAADGRIAFETRRSLSSKRGLTGARLDHHRRLPRVDDRRRRVLLPARPAGRPRPSSSSAAARSRSGRRASACTRPTPARSATSRSRPRRSRPTGST